MVTPETTTGIGTATKITLDSSAVVLTLDSNNTHQIVATVEDVAGTPVNPNQTLTYASDKPNVATVSPTGLITAVSHGRAVIVVRYPWAGNTIGGTSGIPVAAIDAEVGVLVSY